MLYAVLYAGDAHPGLSDARAARAHRRGDGTLGAKPGRDRPAGARRVSRGAGAGPGRRTSSDLWHRAGPRSTQSRRVGPWLTSSSTPTSSSITYADRIRSARSPPPLLLGDHAGRAVRWQRRIRPVDPVAPALP